MEYRHSRQVQLNNLYNQDIAPEDAQITSFYYHKTLALQSFVALFSLFSIAINLANLLKAKNDFAVDNGNNLLIQNLTLFLTAMGIIAILLKKLSQIKWVKQKKQINRQLKAQILDTLLNIIFFLPCPTNLTNIPFTIGTYSFEQSSMNINDLLTCYMLLYRSICIVRFLIHSELYYGSRPDRLSRLYTVQFGTFNAIKFLINQKPLLVVMATFTFNFVVLPFAIMVLQGPVNQNLTSFVSCLHYVVVAQATVGYGDIAPLTIFGRLATVFMILIGITNTSLLLILFVRLMELTSQQQQSLYLLQALERKVKLTRARVKRIQNQWIYSNIFCSPEQKQKKQQEIKAFRYNNRRDIMLDRQGPANVKRMMLSHFSQIVQSLFQIQQKHNIISKCLQVISNSQHKEQISKQNIENSKDSQFDAIMERV